MGLGQDAWLSGMERKGDDWDTGIPGLVSCFRNFVASTLNSIVRGSNRYICCRDYLSKDRAILGPTRSSSWSSLVSPSWLNADHPFHTNQTNQEISALKSVRRQCNAMPKIRYPGCRIPAWRGYTMVASVLPSQVVRRRFDFGRSHNTQPYAFPLLCHR